MQIYIRIKWDNWFGSVFDNEYAARSRSRTTKGDFEDRHRMLISVGGVRATLDVELAHHLREVFDR